MSRRGIQGDERGRDFVSTHGQRLREEVSHIPDAANVLHSELEAANPILEPRKTHVARLRHFWLNGAIGQAHGDFIVAMNRRGRLRVAKVGEHLSLLVRDLGSVDAYKASIAIRIMSDTRDEEQEQEQRWRKRQDRGVLQDTQDLTVTYIIPVIYT